MSLTLRSLGQRLMGSRATVQAAELVLDAPDLPANFYLNVLDWSCRNVVAIGLKEEVITMLLAMNHARLGNQATRRKGSCLILE